jgi:hypothetical protein
MEAGKLMLDHDEIEREGLKAITKVLLGFGGTVVLILGFSTGWRGVLVAGFILSNRIVLSPILLNKRLDFQPQHLVFVSNHAMLFFVDGIIDNQMLSGI